MTERIDDDGTENLYRRCGGDDPVDKSGQLSRSKADVKVMFFGRCRIISADIL